MSESLIQSLAAEINAEHVKAVTAAQTAIHHAIRIGGLLTQAKAELPHGAWLPWCAENLSFGDRQARKYMQLARHQEQIGIENADLTIDAAVMLLAVPKIPEHQHAMRARNLETIYSYLQDVLAKPPSPDLYDMAKELTRRVWGEKDAAFEAIGCAECMELADLADGVLKLAIEVKSRAERITGELLQELHI